LRADDEIYAFYLLQSFGADLRVTADDYNKRLRIFAQHLPHELPALRIRLLGHGARVDDANIRRLAKFNQIVALLPERVANQRRLGLVKPAAEGIKRGF
jgi:hypothetical protein